MFRAFFLILGLLLSPALADDMNAEKAERIGKQIRDRWIEDRPIDEDALRRDGVRRIDGKHLILYTDLAVEPSVDELPSMFDQLIPSLCDYFGLDRKHYDDFRIEGFLIGDFEKFRRGGAVRQVPELRNGYALRNRLWLRDQRSDYYRRHLLLHEGVHVFMGYAFGAWGPPWYREGTAELLGTHRRENGRLTPGFYPDIRGDFSGWGRIETVLRDIRNGLKRSPSQVFELGPEDYNENESYAWSWAFAAFCENHPDYRTAFRRTAWKLTGRPEDVSERFLSLLAEEKSDRGDTEILHRLENDWDDFLFNMVYGYDFHRAKIIYDVPRGKIPPRIRANAGWQNSGIALERGKTYRLTATGRFQLADKPRIWYSEPNGITLRYHRGIPIGTLIATIIPDEEERFLDPNETSGNGFARPLVIGAGTVWTPVVSGTLFIRINDSPSDLDDNRGEAAVDCSEVPPPD